jgi:chromosome segregation ATPase
MPHIIAGAMARLRDYLWAAFKARPVGVPIPPNWVGLAAVGLLGFLNPGFWLIGAGLEAGYLLACVSSKRFRDLVDAKERLRGGKDAEGRVQKVLTRLGAAERQRFSTLDARCRSILAEIRGASSAAASAQADSLAAFRWAYLQLLVMRRSLRKMFEEAGEGEQNMASMLDRVEDLSHRLSREHLPEELRESLTSQQEVLKRRLSRHTEGHDRLEHIESELARIEHHVELVREEAMVAENPERAAERVNRAADSLEGTTTWIREQASLNDTVAGLLAEDPPMIPQ